MTFNELSEKIESQSFDAILSAASGLRIFRNALLNAPSVQQLRELAAQSDSVIEPITKRLNELLSETPEANYRHPHDTAISAYLGSGQVLTDECSVLEPFGVRLAY